MTIGCWPKAPADAVRATRRRNGGFRRIRQLGLRPAGSCSVGMTMTGSNRRLHRETATLRRHRMPRRHCGNGMSCGNFASSR
jgi:hypothetical protein